MTIEIVTYVLANRVKISVTLVDNELDRMGLCRLDVPPGLHSCGMRLPA